MFARLPSRILKVRLTYRVPLDLLPGRRRTPDRVRVPYIILRMYFIIFLRVLRISRIDCLYSRLYFLMERR